MTVGRIYSEVPGIDGTQRWSTSTSARIDSSTIAGIEFRDAQVVRRAVERAARGRQRGTGGSARPRPRNAFSPSKIAWP